MLLQGFGTLISRFTAAVAFRTIIEFGDKGLTTSRTSRGRHIWRGFRTSRGLYIGLVLPHRPCIHCSQPSPKLLGSTRRPPLQRECAPEAFEDRSTNACRKRGECPSGHACSCLQGALVLARAFKRRIDVGPAQFPNRIINCRRNN